jgi:hypothetical protein
MRAPRIDPNAPPPAARDPNDANLLVQLLAAQQQQQAVFLQQQAAFQRQQVEREAQHAAQTENLAQALQRLAEQNGLPRANRKLVEFHGKPDDDVDDWIHSVNQEATAGNWPDLHKLNMAKAALRGAAARWEPGAGLNDGWVAWSTALGDAFRKKFSLQEWFNLVMARKQLEHEPAAQYAIQTKKLLQFCPHPIEEGIS